MVIELDFSFNINIAPLSLRITKQLNPNYFKRIKMMGISLHPITKYFHAHCCIAVNVGVSI